MKYFITILINTIVLNNVAFAMSFDEAKNIINKSSIGTSPDEINNIISMDIPKGIDYILEKTNYKLKVNPPDWVYKDTQDIYQKNNSPEKRKELRKLYNNQEKELKIWWFKQMIFTDSALNERMTMFWHNHFTSSEKKVKIPKLMFQQNELLRKNALGNFRELLHNISKDPAMIIYLDNQQNRKNKPNENFAREVMELFTLGEGNYTETDIKEAARAFTGWKANRVTGKFIFDKKNHDNKNKTFMGKTGNFDGDDILNIILENNKTSLFITKKILKEFIGITPPETEVKRISSIFKDSDYNIKTLIRETLKSKYFNDKKNYGSIIKSPVEIMVGTIRTLNIPLEDKNKNIEQMVKYSKRLGQDIFNPPNVKGWIGGYNWVNSSTLPIRQQLVQRMVRGNEPFSKAYQQKNINLLPSGNIVNLWTNDNNNDLKLIQNIILPIQPINPVNNITTKADFIRKIILDPTYQLK